MSGKGSEPDIELLGLNVAEVPEADTQDQSHRQRRAAIIDPASPRL
jgi:hypothetical protein